MGTFRNVAAPSKDIERGDQGDSDDAAEESADENGEKGAANPKEGTDHGHHFDVTHAHTFAFADQFVEESSAEKKQAAEGCTEEGIENTDDHGRDRAIVEPHAEEAVRGDTRGEGEGNAESEPVDGVGENAGDDVGDDQNDEQAREDEEFERGQSDAEVVVREDKEHPSKEFHRWVHWGDGQVAGAAFAAEEKPAQDRDVVIRSNGSLTTRAAGGGGNNRKALRNAGDADIQERADDDAEKKEEERDHCLNVPQARGRLNVSGQEECRESHGSRHCQWPVASRQPTEKGKRHSLLFRTRETRGSEARFAEDAGKSEVDS